MLSAPIILLLYLNELWYTRRANVPGVSNHFNVEVKTFLLYVCDILSLRLKFKWNKLFFFHCTRHYTFATISVYSIPRNNLKEHFQENLFTIFDVDRNICLRLACVLSLCRSLHYMRRWRSWVVLFQKVWQSRRRAKFCSIELLCYNFLATY